MEPITQKNCTKCGKSKPFDKFPKCVRARDGRSGACYGCRYRSRHYADLSRSRAKGRETSDKYREVNRQLYLESKIQESARYHAARRRLPATLTSKEWQRITAFYHEACAYCGADNTKLFRVRIIPVTQGGEFSARNVAPACPKCSAGKRDRVIRPLLMHNVGEEKALAEETAGADKARVLPGEVCSTGNVAPHPVASYI